jgi:hypothetical protein
MMAELQLLGRGTYGPDVPIGPGISRLWMYKKSVPKQNSVIIYDDGTVEERATFSNLDIAKPNVHTFIYGGTDYRCQSGSFEHDALLAAGYTFREIHPSGIYTEQYEDTY